MATAPKPDFNVPAIPDQKKADALVKRLQIAPAIVVIEDEDTFLASWPTIQRHDEALAKIGEMFDPFVNGLHKMHLMACNLRAQFLDPVAASKKAWLRGRMAYTERKELAAKLKRDADAELLRKAQAKELEKDAKKLEKRGDVESAAVLREQAANVPTPSLPIRPATPKQEGSVVTGRWKYEIENPDEVPREFCDPTPSKINKVVTALGDKIKIPGVRVWYEKSESSRGVKG